MHLTKYFVLLLIPALFSCGGPGKRANNGSDGVSSDSLGMTGDHTSVVIQYIADLNTIQNDLDEIKVKENMVSLNSESELLKTQKDQIILDVQTIYGLLKKSRERIEKLGTQLKNSEIRADGLQRMNDQLNDQLLRHEVRIENLRMALREMNIAFNIVSDSLSKEYLENVKKTAELNTVYVAIGTNAQLVDQGLIVNKGGIFGLGDLPSINPELRRSMFSYNDMKTTREITIAAKKVKLIGLHPPSSYRLEGNKSMIKKLVITDPTAFWGTSKYLVIEVE